MKEKRRTHKSQAHEVFPFVFALLSIKLMFVTSFMKIWAVKIWLVAWPNCSVVNVLLQMK